jgi:hypothetical protein
VVTFNDNTTDNVAHLIAGLGSQSGTGASDRQSMSGGAAHEFVPVHVQVESVVAEGNNDVTWDESWVFDECVMPGASLGADATGAALAQTDADAEVASRARAHLGGQPVGLLCTLVLLPEGAQVGGEVLGDVLIKMDKTTFSLADQWFPLSLSRTCAQPRIIHPAPVVEVHLRLAYEDVSWQHSTLQIATDRLPLTPRAQAPENAVDESHDEQHCDAVPADRNMSLQQRKGRLKVAAKHKTQQPKDVGGNPDPSDNIDSNDTSAYSVSVRLLSTAGISTPEDFALENGLSDCWCCASVLMSADVGKLKEVTHVAPGSSSHSGQFLKENSCIVAQTWCRPDASPHASKTHSGASVVCGWRTEEMVLTSAVCPSAAGAQDRETFELDGEPMILLITLHAGLKKDGQELEIARALLPIRQGLGGDMWCQALTSDQQQLEVDAGPPCLVHVRVAYARNAYALPSSSSSRARHQREHMLNVFVSPASGITNLLRAMVAAGPPCALSDVATLSLDDEDSNDLVLPAGWIRRVSRSSKKPYYASRVTSRSTFRPPTGSRLAVARIPLLTLSSQGVSVTGAGSVEGDWAVRMTIREAVGLAQSQAHTRAEDPAASPKVSRFRFAVSLVFFQQGEVDASHLLSLEHLLPGLRGGGGGGKFKPQALSQWVAGASGISEVMETFVLRNAVLVNQTGISTCCSEGQDVKDEPAAENSEGAELQVALKGRVVLLFVTVHTEDDSAGGNLLLFPYVPDRRLH